MHTCVQQAGHEPNPSWVWQHNESLVLLRRQRQCLAKHPDTAVGAGSGFSVCVLAARQSVPLTSSKAWGWSMGR